MPLGTLLSEAEKKLIDTFTQGGLSNRVIANKLSRSHQCIDDDIKKAHQS